MVNEINKPLIQLLCDAHYSLSAFVRWVVVVGKGQRGFT